MARFSNPPAVLDQDGFTVRRTIRINAPVDRVWSAITDPAQIARWFGQAAVLDELAIGAGGVLSSEGYGDFPILIVELDPPHLIAYRWSNEHGGRPRGMGRRARRAGRLRRGRRVT